MYTCTLKFEATAFREDDDNELESISDHTQRMTVEDFGECLKERWKALTKDLK